MIAEDKLDHMEIANMARRIDNEEKDAGGSETSKCAGRRRKDRR